MTRQTTQMFSCKVEISNISVYQVYRVIHLLGISFACFCATWYTAIYLDKVYRFVMRHNIVARIIFDQASTEQNTSFNTHCTALDTSTHYQIHINYTVTVDPNAYKWKNKPQNIQSSCITTYAWCFLSWQSVIIMQIFSSG